MQVEALASALASGCEQLERRYYAAAVRTSAVLFESNWSLDYDLPGVQAPPPPTPGVIRAYRERVFRAAVRDPVLAYAVRRIMNGVDSPMRLLHPAIAWRALARPLWRRSGTAEIHSDPAEGARTV